MDYVKIPQNVRVEDKLIGPLSLKQIIIIAIGGGVSYVIFTAVQKSAGTVPTAAHLFIWIPLIITSAFAVVRVNDIPLTRYFLLVLESMSKPRVRVWQPRKGILVLPMTTTKTKKKKKRKNEDEEVEKKVEKSNVRLEDLSVLLDSEGHRNDQKKSQPLNSSEQTIESTPSSTH